jgi:alkylation response protein AidB-like acyl-CoA dehydrogenase
MARTDRVLAAKPSTQSDVAQAVALVAMARAYLREVVSELWGTVTAGGDLSLEQQGRARLAMVSCMRNAVRAVDLVYEAGGATSIYEASPLARCFRDVHVASQHAAVQMASYEVAGQTILGVTPRSPFVF